jgi:hypothetical protein
MKFCPLEKHTVISRAQFFGGRTRCSTNESSSLVKARVEKKGVAAEIRSEEEAKCR